MVHQIKINKTVKELELERVKSIIGNSGNDHHVNVEKKLKIAGWDVTSSPYYNDPVTGIPREADIIAYKDFDIHKFPFNEKVGMLRIRLFIECKFLSEPIVLWLKDKKIDDATTLAMDNPILNGRENLYLHNNGKIHHYIESNKVINKWAKQGHIDQLYEAMSGCLNSFIYYEQSKVEKHSPTISFPIIVVNDISRLFIRDESNYGATSSKDSQQLEVIFSYKYDGLNYKQKYFLIDIVDNNNLEIFLTKLGDNDIDILRNSLHWQLSHP
ncbi:MAG: hypothetical protein V1668_00875 [Patescibacteria group bacterium]